MHDHFPEASPQSQTVSNSTFGSTAKKLIGIAYARSELATKNWIF